MTASSSSFYDLVSEIQRCYVELATHDASLSTERDRLRLVVEGLLGAYGKYVDEKEIARWRALSGVAPLAEVPLDSVTVFVGASSPLEKRPVPGTEMLLVVSTEDSSLDGSTGLYFDRPFDAEDLEWLKRAWDALLRGGGDRQRPTQLMLVFQMIRGDELATREFLRVMNTVLLPLLRQLRLKSKVDRLKAGVTSE